MNNQHHIVTLFEKYIANDCTEHEVAALIDIIRLGEHKDLIEALLYRHFEEHAGELQYQAVAERVFEKLHLQTVPGKTIMPPAKRAYAFMKIAAAAVLIIVSAFMAYTYFLKEKDKIPAGISQDIAPGGNRATLILSDGRQLTLNEIQLGNITEEDGTIIKKSADGQVAYFPGNNTKKHKGFNTIKTPKGGQYQVVLPDGSKVWLNAASSLTYPASFDNMERRVQLAGEGYFEIASKVYNKKRIPFIVETGKQQIEVLGTRFNVNAYDDETGIKTTLIEGKVKVITENETVILKPHQEFNLRSDGINTQQVEVEAAIDWKNGDFIFADEDIKSVMRKIARWYNVEVVYDNTISPENLSGQISRNRNLSEVLRMLELSGNIRFTIDNGVIHIY
ncbi:FecR family protein [Agriterribacter sp.]|uniref:FecR family protein n=1 Tax=Agriterribacter sp. TaxID=2821509 RepID=UPI002B7E420F|nr:FecR family protein [Agriterribacter sp.]HRO46717.1 FecR family protein [Agriterribacter sp.]HRQ18905.1 FecR family protein [Agriterribacter sp.]